MKAIDRAIYWTEMLEQVGYDIEVQTDAVSSPFGQEYVTVFATKGNDQVWFDIDISTKFTRFISGEVTYYGRSSLGTTRKPSQMSQWVSSQVQKEHYKMQRGVSA